MDNVTFQKIRDLLDKHEVIGIAVGNNPTVDEMAAALSLNLYLSSLNKKVSIASPAPTLVELSSLVGIDKVKTSLDGDSGDLIVSFPYQNTAIQKVSYTIEEGFLNIVVKADEKGLNFLDNEVKFRRGGGVPTLLFVVGTSRLLDLGTLFNPEALKDTVVVNIDNKADNQGFGDVVLVSANFSSVSEQMTRLLTYFEPKLEVDIAQNLLAGISFATDNFQNPKTSYVAFEMAGMLLRSGAQRGIAHKSKYQDVDESLMSFVPQAPIQPPVQRPMQDQRPMQPKREEKTQVKSDKNPTPDWLTPKVYKGQTNV